jgi:hypothetical protein
LEAAFATSETAQELLNLGARKVIIGSALLTEGRINREYARALADAIPKAALMFALDSRGGRVAIDGWRTETAVTAFDMIRELEPFCETFLYTHIDTEGLMGGIPMETVQAIRRATTRHLVVAGGITEQHEIDSLDALGIDAVVGMALYSGKIRKNWDEPSYPMSPRSTGKTGRRAAGLQAVTALGTESEACLDVRSALRTRTETRLAQNEVEDDAQRVRNEDGHQRPQDGAHTAPAGVPIHIPYEQNPHDGHSTCQECDANPAPEWRGLGVVGHHHDHKNLHPDESQDSDEIGNRGNDADLVRESGRSFIPYLHRTFSFSHTSFS